MAGVDYLVCLFVQDRLGSDLYCMAESWKDRNDPSIWVAERVIYKGLADQGESMRDNVVPRGWAQLGSIPTLVLKREGGKWLLEPERKL